MAWAAGAEESAAADGEALGAVLVAGASGAGGFAHAAPAAHPRSTAHVAREDSGGQSIAGGAMLAPAIGFRMPF